LKATIIYIYTFKQNQNFVEKIQFILNFNAIKRVERRIGECLWDNNTPKLSLDVFIRNVDSDVRDRMGFRLTRNGAVI